MASAFNQILLPYQKAWLKDESRFKIGMWSRQTGKSFATAAEAVKDCLVRPGQLWVCLSAGERQAFEWLRKAKQWTDALKVACTYAEMPDAADARCSKGEISFKNGSRILAIPANPDTARGYSANLILDEFAIHEKSWDIWAAIFPSISNPLSGEKKLRIVSTPKGLGNKFADLWLKNEAYSKHKVTIEDAAAAGLKVDIEALKAGVDDADVWAQEYLCEFIDASGVLLPYEMIQGCTMAETPAERSDEPAYIGMDIGRSHDLSVVVEAAKRADGILEVRRVDVLRKMPFAEQLEELRRRASARNVRRVCVDATGIGAMLAEEAARRCGRKVEPVVFTAKSKGEMYAALRRAFEDRTVRIPPDRDLREDLHAVEKRVSQGGTVSYSATRNADGHSDRAAALALCIRAAQSQGLFFIPRIFGRRRDPDERTAY
jgi:phage FluMu gp28-like protein